MIGFLSGKNAVDKDTERTDSNRNRKVITPLGRMLLTAPMDRLTEMLTQLGVRYSICGNIRSPEKGFGHHLCTIFIQDRVCGETKTVRQYTSTSGKTAKQALVSAMANFLINEDHAFHDYKQLKEDLNYEESML